MTILSSNTQHYIRCIKPNENKAPNQLEAELTIRQLRYAGVFEAVDIRKRGYPFRKQHINFFHRYGLLARMHLRKIVRELNKHTDSTSSNTVSIAQFVAQSPARQAWVDLFGDNILRDASIHQRAISEAPKRLGEKRSCDALLQLLITWVGEVHGCLLGETMVLYRAEQHRALELQRSAYVHEVMEKAHTLMR